MNTDSKNLDKRSAAFALAAAVAVLFNTALAWVKDAYAPLNTFMAHLFGHHWTTHGLFDLAVFVALGLLFNSTGIASRIEPQRLVAMLFAAVVIAGLGLAGWFLLF